MFHVRRRPADSQPRRRKKKPLGVSNGGNNIGGDREGPMLIEITHSGDGGRRVKLGSEPIEVGSANTNALQLFGPSIQARHCLISMHDGVCTVTPLHADGTTFVNGHHIQQPTILHNGSVVMFGRVASYRFVDSPSDGRYNLALSQSQLDSACLYESRSPTSPTSWNDEESRPISPISSVQMGGKMPAGSNAGGGSFLDGPIASTSADSASSQPQSNSFAKTPSFDMQSTAGAQQSQQTHPHMHLHHHHHPSGLLVTALDGPDAMGADDTASYKGGHAGNDHNEGEQQQQHHAGGGGPFGAGNGGETETKSISSFKSIGSTTDRTSTFPKLQPSHAATSISGEPGGQEPILPAVLEFPEQNQEPFLQSVISELDVNSPNFKLAPVYTLYLCARYRASTHYRPDLQPTERAHKLTVFLHHVANLIQNVVQEQYTDAKILSFWMANSSEFLHFLKSDRHISAFSVQAQEVLAESVQTAFRNLVSIFHVELSQTLNQFLSENIDHDSAAGLFVTTSHMCTSAWGKALSERLSLLELWAEKQGLELAADCHLAKINQCAQFLQAPKTSVSDVQQLACSCFRLNSLQMAALLSQETIPRNLIDTAVRMAESVADELSRADGREIRLEESPELPLALLLPDDGFSCDVVRGIPAGLVDFLNPFQMAGWCRLASQPTSIGLWTVYMHQFNHGRSPSVMSSKLPQPEVQIIKLHKNANGMGLSIVAAKGAGQERLGIYIKSVVGGGAADLDGRLQAGDQLLEVDGQSLIGITQERAADHLVRTGPIVTLKVAKQGAIYHGLATLLQQPSPVIQREMENEFNCNVYDNDGNHRYHFGRSNESLNFYGSGGGSHQSRRGSLRRPLSSVMMNHTYSTPYLTQNDAAYRRMSNPDISQRRYSLSLSHEDILSNDQLQQIHFDPRYRDCRSSNSLNSIYYNHQRTRSNSLNSIGRIGTIMKPVRYDTPPSIYVEDYDTRSNSHSSREMIKIEETAEPETPVVEERRPSCVFEIRIEAPSTESNLSFVADVNLDDIPFIDEDDADEEEAPGSRSRGTGGCGTNVSTQTTPAVVVNSPSTVTISDGAGAANHNHNSNISTTTGGNLPSIMINTASRRGSNASCRKTVSFDIINDHHPYDDSDEEDRAKGKPYNGQGNVENVAPDMNSGRRMSERDMTRVGTSSGDISKPPVPSTSAGQQLLNSKSVPALHHVGNIGASANKSRSIHNLAGGGVGGGSAGTIGTAGTSQDQGFYQNLSVYRAQNQSHPNLGERPPMPLQTSLNSPGASSTVHQQQQMLQHQHQQQLQQQQHQQHPILNRPASAYFNSNNSGNNTNPSNLLLTTQNTMSYTMPNQQQPNSSNNGNLANISQQQQQGNMNTMNNRLASTMGGKQQAVLPGGAGNNGNVNGFMRDAQAQQSLRMNQMMAPSMPNIAHSVAGSGYPAPGVISASQSMQNVNVIPGGPGSPAGGYNYHGSANGSPMLSPQMYPHDGQQQLGAQHHSSLLRGQAKLAEMNELIKRRQQQQQQPVSYNTATTNKPPQQSQQGPNATMPPSTAPKPLRAQDDQPPLPPASTHPMFKPGTGGPAQLNNNAYSSADPPKVGFYPTMPSQSKNLPQAGSSPWEREEKEKESELRREHVRAWRDQQIVELQSLPQRTPKQEEQLRTLILERDFERRAMEEDQDYDNDMPPYGAKEHGNVQEVVRLTQPNSGSLTAPMTKLKQVDIKTPAADTLSITSSEQSVPSVSTAIANFQQQQQAAGGGAPPLIQPKSILKHNNNSSTPSSPSKGAAKTASFAHDGNNPLARAQLNLSEITANNTNANQMMSQMVHDMNQMNLSNMPGATPSAALMGEDRENSEYGHPMTHEQQTLMNGGGGVNPYMLGGDANNGNGVPPPPPPERNSSYVIMSQQQQKLRTSTAPTKLSFSGPTTSSPALDMQQQQQQQQQNAMNNNVNTMGGRYNNNNLLMTAPNNGPLNNNQSTAMGGANSNVTGGNASLLTNNSYKDNKRVSFHDEDAGNNNAPMMAAGPAGYTQAGHLIGGSIGNETTGGSGELGTILERPDPDRFIDETMPAMLHTPTTPDGENWNMQIQATPGVIGAQEVYRDPRTRRLAEQQQKQKSEAVPEKLSFKEKMKMFALESGENNTPKDKLKISRAQRDIDAVH
uniref:PDZ domain-containing protein n=1 Tax=Anopheles minimus TaxID=112268 RepID=A0A182VX10_9DIPT